MPFVRIHTLHSVPDDHWAQWHRGPLATLLVDPAAEEWRLASDLGLPTVVVHSVPDLQAAVDAVLHGAYALVWQNDVPSDLASVLALVAHGYRALSAAYIGYLAEWMSKLIGRPESDVPELTAREQDILRSIARGHTVRQTARSLGIAAKTVENTQTRLFRKLGTRSRSETLTAAYRMGLLELKIGQPTRDARSG
jgi:DNA-binding NarL/FixJ family response regulator